MKAAWFQTLLFGALGFGLAVMQSTTAFFARVRLPSASPIPEAYFPVLFHAGPTTTVTPTPTPTPTQTPTPSLTPTPNGLPLFRFAIIGDYGLARDSEAEVSKLVHSWNPDFILTTGDNNYYQGEATTIDQNIGQYYHDFIFPYLGNYGAGAKTNRFFPAPGNHDWYSSSGLQPYLNYLTLPGNERYYDFVWGGGAVHFFIVDSDPNEPDGITATSIQAQWLQAQLSLSTAQWNVVLMHHAPYSSSNVHGSHPTLQWPYGEWGANVVLAGHDHTYERLDVNGVTYFVNGLGGSPSIYGFAATPLPESRFRYNDDWGAQLVEVYSNQMVFTFITRAEQVIDSYGVWPNASIGPRSDSP